MKVLDSLEAPAAREQKNVVLTIGVFDGVHRGHRAVIEKVVEEARRLSGVSALVTFRPHPRQVLAPAGAPPLLTSQLQKERLLAALGLDLCVVVPFTRRIAREGAAAFVRDHLLGSMDVRAMCVGPRFAFGRGREGDVRLLERLGAEQGFDLTLVEPVRIGGVHVSSTAIRKMVTSGELRAAALFLGRPFAIAGTVVRGKELGRRLGVPTANIDASGMAIPPPGVYAVVVVASGAGRRGVLNIDRKGGIEAHIFDSEEELYGSYLEAIFKGRIRDEKVFPDLRDLTAQVRSDIEIAKRMLHNEAALSGKRRMTGEA